MDLTRRQRLVFAVYEGLSRQSALTEAQRLEKLQWETSSAFENARDAQLRQIIRHAGEHVEHYRTLFSEAGLRPDQIRSSADLARLPATTRADVRRGFPPRFLVEGVPARRRIERVTSGSTGMPLSFTEDRDAESRRLAAYLLARSWAGTSLGDTMVFIASPFHLRAGAGYSSIWTKRARRLLLGERIEHLSGLHLEVSEFRSIVNSVPAGGRYFIWSFPSYLSWLAVQLQAQGGLASAPTAVVAFGETLTPIEASHLSDVFAAPVVNHYSLWELPHVAQSCPEHPDRLHLLGDRAIVRIARPDGSDAEVGEIGRVLITNLTNYVMPFLNYETGDLAARGEPCPCGRGFPTLQALHGRFSETITTPSGLVLSPVTLGYQLVFVLHAEQYIWEYQLVQVEPDRVALRVVPTDSYSASFEAKLAASLTDLFEHEMRVDVVTVDRIDHEPSGKRLLTKVELSETPKTRADQPGPVRSA